MRYSNQEARTIFDWPLTIVKTKFCNIIVEYYSLWGKEKKDRVQTLNVKKGYIIMIYFHNIQ